MVNPALEALDWDPPRFAGTAWQNAWINPVMWNAFMGWTGVDQYDEANLVGQEFLDRYQKRFGRRSEWCPSSTTTSPAPSSIRSSTRTR